MSNAFRGGRWSFVRVGMSASDQQGGFGPEALAIASAAFAKSWRFIESDPVLEGHDHELMQAELVRAIAESLKTGERDEIRIANGAIRRTRDRMLKPEKHSAL